MFTYSAKALILQVVLLYSSRYYFVHTYNEIIRCSTEIGACIVLPLTTNEFCITYKQWVQKHFESTALAGATIASENTSMVTLPVLVGRS